MKKIISNYHTHCNLCNHALGSIEDYILQAINDGFTDIGISDHAPFDFLNERSVRMSINDFESYKGQLDDAIVHYSKQINIYKGIEIEYFKHMDDHYQALKQTLDYLILGQHYIDFNSKLISTYHIHTMEELTHYKDTVVEAMRTGYFKILAHPEICFLHQPVFTKAMIDISREIIETAKATNTLLEINANGFRKKKQVTHGYTYRIYPREEFWLLVKDIGAKTIISADAHKPKQLMDHAMKQAYKFADDMSLEVEEALVFN